MGKEWVMYIAKRGRYAVIGALVISGGCIVVAGATYVTSAESFTALANLCANNQLVMALVSEVLSGKTGYQIP